MFALIDCNNFFVSCEKVFRPDLSGKPVAVLSNNDGCIVARSQEVKDLKIPMGAPVFKHREVLNRNKVKLFSANFQLYGDMSLRVMNVLRQFVPKVEIYSIDEAFLNLKNLKITNLDKYSREIRDTVVKWTGIPVSVGIAPTKTLAKVANEHAKKLHKGGKTAFVMIKPKQIDAILKDLDVGDLWGIGWNLAPKLKAKGIFTAYDLKYADERFIRSYLGVTVQRIIFELRGIECISTDAAPESRKAIMSSRSFGDAITELPDLKEAVASFTTIAAEKLRKQKSICSIIYVSIRTSKHRFGEQYSYLGDYVTLSTPTSYTPILINAAHSILERIYKKGIPYKKASVMLGGIVPASASQINMFEQNLDVKKASLVMEGVDKVNRKFGKMTLKLAALGKSKKWKGKRENVSNRYTTKWEELIEAS